MRVIDETRTVVIPDHVPPHLVWADDVARFASEMDDPYIAIARLSDGPEIIWATSANFGEPAWVPTRHSIIEDVFMDADSFISGENNTIGALIGVDWKLNPLEIDPPQHTRYRRILQPWFVPSAISRLHGQIVQIADDLIGDFRSKGGCEFIGEFASKFPSLIFLDLMGLPHDKLTEFMQWERAFLHGLTPEERAAGAGAIAAYLEMTADERRHAPPRDDLISHIISAEVDGRPLDRGEIMGMCMVLYVGGLDTVMSSLGWYFMHLAGDQALQARLRKSPSDIPDAVDDLLRAYGVTSVPRRVSRDMVFHGVHLKKGDVMMTPTYLAGRDPRKYDRPEVVDPDRKARHLTLATGVHNCLGIHLAKREIAVVLQAFLSRFENIRIAYGERIEWHAGGTWGIDRLPLVWDC